MNTGLAVDDLLAAMRPHAQLKQRDRSLLMALVAYANNETAITHREIIESVVRQNPDHISVDDILTGTQAGTGGTLNELTDGLGDSFVFPFRETMDLNPSCSSAPVDSQIWPDAIEFAREQGLLSNRWYLAWYFFMDALWLDAQLIRNTVTDWRLVQAAESQVIRQIGAARRQKKIEALSLLLSDMPPTHVASRVKTLAIRFTGDRIALSLRSTKRQERSWSQRIQQYAVVPSLYYSAEIEGVKLNVNGQSLTVGEAARFYSSLMALFYDLLNMMPRRTLHQDVHRRDAFGVGLPNLAHCLSELIEIDGAKIKTLLELATFYGKSNEIVWGKPLMFAGTDRRFIFLPALKSSLLRTLNRLINEYADDHGKKGIFFQEYSRQRLMHAAAGGPLRDVTWVSPRAVETETGDIDICILVGDVLIAVEAKFQGVPSDAYEYWGADRVLDDARSQIKRKVEVIGANLEAFVRTLRQRYSAPNTEVNRIVPVVLTSDAYHAGFVRNDVSVTDLDIAAVFFDNALVALSERTQRGVSEQVIQIYNSPADAIAMVESYFREPLIIRRLMNHIQPRELSYHTHVQNEGAEIVVTAPTVQVIPHGHLQ